MEKSRCLTEELPKFWESFFIKPTSMALIVVCVLAGLTLIALISSSNCFSIYQAFFRDVYQKRLILLYFMRYWTMTIFEIFLIHPTRHQHDSQFIILCQFSFSNILRDCTWLTLDMNSSRLIVFLDIIFVYLSVILTSFCQNYQTLLFWLNYDICWFAQKVHTFFLKVFHCNSRSYRGVICPMI